MTPVIAYKFSITQKPDMQAKIRALEKSMMGMEPVDCPVKHQFAPGMYAREITIPKGTVLTGAVHKMDNIAVLSKGKLQLVTDDGTTIIEAPHTLVCKAGKKNAALALETAVWTNFLPTDETDIDKLTEIFTESKPSELLGGKDNAQRIAYAKLQELEH